MTYEHAPITIYRSNSIRSANISQYALWSHISPLLAFHAHFTAIWKLNKQPPRRIIESRKEYGIGPLPV